MNKNQKQQQNTVECDYQLSEYETRGMMPCDYSGFCCGTGCSNYYKCHCE